MLRSNVIKTFFQNQDQDQDLNFKTKTNNVAPNTGIYFKIV